MDTGGQGVWRGERMSVVLDPSSRDNGRKEELLPGKKRPRTKELNLQRGGSTIDAKSFEKRKERTAIMWTTINKVSKGGGKKGENKNTREEMRGVPSAGERKIEKSSTSENVKRRELRGIRKEEN